MRPAASIVLVILAACGGTDAPDDAPDAAELPGTWREAPDLDAAIQETAAVALDGRIYVIGAYGAGGAVVRVFDTATEAWSTDASLPLPVHHANAAVVDGTIYVLGFLTGEEFFEHGDVYALTPGVDAAWRPRASMPAGTSRGAGVVGVVDGIVYVAGGLRSGGAVAFVSAYDPVADAWDDTVPDLPGARDHACGAAIDGTIYVAGGRQGSFVPRAAVFALTPGGDWTGRANMITARAGTGCGVIDGRLVVVGGEGAATGTGVFRETESYDPASDSWESLTPMTTPRHGMAGAVVDGALYVPGGARSAGFGAVAVHEVFTF